MDTAAGSAAPSDIRSQDAYRPRIAELEARLAEAEETLDAIRSGEVDAVVVGDMPSRPLRRLIRQPAQSA